MKTKKLHRIVSGMLMLLFSVTGIYAQEITITSPTSETIWKGGDSCTITWGNTLNAPEYFNIKLVLDNMIITGLDGGAGIHVPTAAGRYTFKLESKDRSAGKIYSICFETENEMTLGCSPSFEIRKGQATGISEPDAVQDLTIYPVPVVSNTKLSFVLKEKSQLDIRVYDLLGHEIACLKNEEVNAGRQEVPFGLDPRHGIYLVQIKTQRGVVSRRIVAAP